MPLVVGFFILYYITPKTKKRTNFTNDTDCT